MIFDTGSYYCKTIRARYLIQTSIIVQNKDMIFDTGQYFYTGSEHFYTCSFIVKNKDMFFDTGHYY